VESTGAKGCSVHDDGKLDFGMGGGVTSGKGGNRGCCMHGNAGSERSRWEGLAGRGLHCAIPTARN
jgi:hypothetical protein